MLAVFQMAELEEKIKSCQTIPRKGFIEYFEMC
jgi:hypothetical protein